MGRSNVPHEAQQGLHFCHPLLIDCSPSGSLGQIAFRELACDPQKQLEHRRSLMTSRSGRGRMHKIGTEPVAHLSVAQVVSLRRR